MLAWQRFVFLNVHSAIHFFRFFADGEAGGGEGQMRKKEERRRRRRRRRRRKREREGGRERGREGEIHTYILTYREGGRES